MPNPRKETLLENYSKRKKLATQPGSQHRVIIESRGFHLGTPGQAYHRLYDSAIAIVAADELYEERARIIVGTKVAKIG